MLISYLKRKTLPDGGACHIGGGKSNTSASTTSTAQADNRIVADHSTVLGTDSSLYNDYSTRLSSSWSDSSTRNTSLSNSGNTDNSMLFQTTDGRSWANSGNTDNSMQLSDSRAWNTSNSGNTSADNRINYTSDSRSTFSNDDRDSYNYDGSNRSTYSSDSRSTVDDRDSYGYDSSNRSTTTNNFTGTDGGAVQIAQYNAGLMKDISANQTDGTKVLANMGADVLARLGDSVTNVWNTSGANMTTAWEHQMAQSSDVIEKMLTAAGNTTDAARTIAATAMSTYQPAENKAQDTALKLGMIAAAGVAIVMLTRK